VRKKDKERMALIQGALDRNQDKINKILDDFGIPHVAVVEGDSVMKVYRKGSTKAKDEHGDASSKLE
ncbi:MAG: quinoprotein dehydrogenase-associated putative ABC transporter substrate-binding protein, partial [Methylotenera sp.]|nr:quinoprotein dehydrogenase-associated putative ABC transporter substrate-binding protein [Methylotenera sp.]